MAESPFDVITRGVDSSGRVLKQTRQAWQAYDRINLEFAQGLLVLIQGGWSFADASANTHALGMCRDFRTWNLSEALRTKVVHGGRDLGCTMYYRTESDGFDPHIHDNVIGDRPADPSAIAQVGQYELGLNGLANRARDRDPYRPKIIRPYRYILEDDMFEKEDRELLKKISRQMDAEKTRDQAERERDKARFERLTTVLGNQADSLTEIINKTTDTATKTQLRKVKENILLQLKNDPDVKEKDNPSDDAMGEMNLG